MHTTKKILQNLASFIKLALLGIALNSFSSLVHAGSAMCSPENGGGARYDHFLQEAISASDNERGKKYERDMIGGTQNYTLSRNRPDS